ncbi:spore germination protein [Bacillus mesophilus]|uniref:Spore germination protein n=1 Tax=Bacillus mesophilus TaxID=1808955 RepID=A0A6M0Q448_9BACI|nr:spore germination protein [Bacillus mesophilus]MBM7661315.1 spore germination protein [Bacillus mesophilus]NEY71165.1 spore germination protein [Bacillus mesophilus]
MFFKKKQNTIEWLNAQLGSSRDIVNQQLYAEHNKAKIFYIKSLCDDQQINKLFIDPFYEESSKQYKNYLHSLHNKKQNKSNGEILTDVLNGTLVMIMENEVYLFDVQKVINNTISESTVETVIQGPQNALTEHVYTNLNLVRNRYPQPSLRVEETKVGLVSQTKTMIVYDKRLVHTAVLEEMRQSLEKVDVDMIQAAGELSKGLTKSKKTLFPTMMITERPDRIAQNIAQGKVVLLIDGTPFALIAPAVFYDFMSSMEDVYQAFWISRFIVTLRYIGLFISLSLPAVYVGVTAYNPELFRVQLALSIAGSRVGVPYPAYLEVFLMLIMMELLTEASVRLPKAIGSTATTVGGLILGQAAVEAGLVSNVMIIIVAAVAISNFVIPINAMSFAMRVTKYVLLAFTTFFGMVGLVFSFILLIAYLANLDSFGEPYLKIFFLSNSKEAKLAKQKKKEAQTN